MRYPSTVAISDTAGAAIADYVNADSMLRERKQRQGRVRAAATRTMGGETAVVMPSPG